MEPPQIVGSVRCDSPNDVEVRLNHWPQSKSCTAVQYGNDIEAEKVFNHLQTFARKPSPYVGMPFCFKGNRVAYGRCSRDAFSLLHDQRFPSATTYNAVRDAIAGMMDLHESGIGGLPDIVSPFVRIEDRRDICKLYYASTSKDNYDSDYEWERQVVQQDYRSMEKFVRQMFGHRPNLDNPMDLMKSETLVNDFVRVLGDHSRRSYDDRKRTRSLVLGHPLLMTCEETLRFVKVVGWRCSKPNLKRREFERAVENVPQQDWRANVRGAHESKYTMCLAKRRDSYENSSFVEYYRDFLTHPKDYGLHAAVPALVRQFEEFYPSYLGLLWAALDNQGLCPEM